ncbi:MULTISPECIES: VOC family protein [Streptomyces]|uniref:VOC family protein n=1 Tax=Streptomyces TaxID=1883 RepID=UPI00069967A7|nr:MULTISPECIES: VOC family protein [Streptomyces]MYU50751.1 glyoxalase/bleomycin resistance/dioxygenase family protein [Streptomyces sp. SID7805]
MGLTMRVVELECTDPLKLGEFWSAVLEAPVGPGKDGVNIAPRGGGEMRLYLVEERAPGHPRSRTRLWLNPVEGAWEAEVARLTGLGARVVEKYWTNRSCGLAVVVLADPEGNGFCVESSDREVAEVVRRFEDPSDDLDGLGPGPESTGFVGIDVP